MACRNFTSDYSLDGVLQASPSSVARSPLECQSALNRAERAHIGWNSVAIGDRLIGERRDARARGENPNQVQRVAALHQGGCRGSVLTAHGTQRLNRRWQGKLLTDESLDESTAPNLAAGLQAAHGGEQLAPGWQRMLAGQQIAEDDAVSAQELPDNLLNALGVAGARALANAPERPAADRQGSSSADPGMNCPQVAGRRPSFGLRLEQHAKSCHAVTTHQSAAHQLPERILDFGRQPSSAMGDIGQKRGAALGEKSG